MFIGIHWLLCCSEAFHLVSRVGLVQNFARRSKAVIIVNPTHYQIDIGQLRNSKRKKKRNSMQPFFSKGKVLTHQPPRTHASLSSCATARDWSLTVPVEEQCLTNWATSWCANLCKSHHTKETSRRYFSSSSSSTTTTTIMKKVLSNIITSSY